MRHQKTGRKLSRRKEHRKAMLSNLAASLIIHGRVKTTDAKAKEVRPFVERLVTFARRGDLHARRIVHSRLRDASAVKKLFDEIGPQFAGRFGGYTRIVKLGFRPGDNSPVSLIEFVSEDEPKKAPKKKKTSKTKAPKPSKAETPVVEKTAPETEAADATVETSDTAEATPETAPEVETEVAEAVEVEEEAPAEQEAPAEEKQAAEEEKAADEPAEEKNGDDSEAKKTEE